MSTMAPLLRRLCLLLAAAGALPVHAAEFITIEDECNGRQLLIQGPIVPGDHARFTRRLAQLVAGGDLPDVQDPDVLWTVELDSPGGDAAEAMRIGRLLRDALATTEVSYRFARRPDGVWDYQRSGDLVCLNGEDRLAGCHPDLVEAECIGACVLIWLAGAERHANEGKLGLHGLTGDESAATGRYLTELGVTAAWRARLLEAVGNGWLSWPERHELSGRATELGDLTDGCPPALTPQESFRSVAAESAAERDRLMDRADAHRSCRRARLAAARADTVAWLAGSGG